MPLWFSCVLSLRSMVVLLGLVRSTTEGRNSSRPSLLARARLFYSARPTKTAMLRRLVRLGKILLVNWLILMPAVLVKIAYSAQNSARTPPPSGRIYFRKYSKEPGPNPLKLIRYCNSSYFNVNAL